MTLIALTVNKGLPVLMGDILISSKGENKNIPLPTFVNGSSARVSYSDTDEHRPMRLEQKLYVINDRLCVALGGDVDQMRRFLNRLKALYDTPDFDDAALKDCVKCFPKEESCYDFIAIVLKYIPQQERGPQFDVQCVGQLRFLNNQLYDRVIAGGSGAPQFLDFIGTNPRFETDMNDARGPLAANQSLIAYWLAREASQAESLSNHWGAGFEMIYFDNGRFVKLDEYTVALLVGKFGERIETQVAPFSTMMINYQSDIMVVRVFAHDQEVIFAAPSISDNREIIEVSYTEPSYRTLLLAYVLHDVSKGIEYNPVISFPTNKNQRDFSPIVFKRVSGKLQLEIDQKIHNYVLGELSDRSGFGSC